MEIKTTIQYGCDVCFKPLGANPSTFTVDGGKTYHFCDALCRLEWSVRQAEKLRAETSPVVKPVEKAVAPAPAPTPAPKRRLEKALKFTDPKAHFRVTADGRLVYNGFAAAEYLGVKYRSLGMCEKDGLKWSAIYKTQGEGGFHWYSARNLRKFFKERQARRHAGALKAVVTKKSKGFKPNLEGLKRHKAKRNAAKASCVKCIAFNGNLSLPPCEGCLKDGVYRLFRTYRAEIPPQEPQKQQEGHVPAQIQPVLPWKPTYDINSSCPHCGGDPLIANPTGNCDHIHFPEGVNKSLRYVPEVKP